MLSNVADLTEALCAMANDGQAVTADLAACISPYLREHIRRFGRFSLNMADLPEPLNPRPLPFEAAL
jgi:Tn3 transposase DDE domain